jgi:hypothetical protein
MGSSSNGYCYGGSSRASPEPWLRREPSIASNAQCEIT